MIARRSLVSFGIALAFAFLSAWLGEEWLGDVLSRYTLRVHIRSDTTGQAYLHFEREGDGPARIPATSPVVASVTGVDCVFLLPPGRYQKFRLLPLDRAGSCEIAEITLTDGFGRAVLVIGPEMLESSTGVPALEHRQGWVRWDTPEVPSGNQGIDLTPLTPVDTQDWSPTAYLLGIFVIFTLLLVTFTLGFRSISRPEDGPLGSKWARCGFLVGFFLTIAGAKFLLINDTGSDLPYGDQWDTEASALYVPWGQGKLSLGMLFAAHNEHRIVITRLYNLAILAINGQWDPRLQMVTSALVHAGVLTLILHAGWRWLGDGSRAVALGLGATLLGALPLGWENTIAGSHSQFYFLLGFTFWHLAGTLHSKPLSGRWWLAHAAGWATLGTMAAGYSSAAVLLVALPWRCWKRRDWTKADALTVLLNLIILVAGLIIRPDAPPDGVFQAKSLSQFAVAGLDLLAWPSPHRATSCIIAAPIIGWMAYIFTKRGEHKGDTLFLALGGWWLAQVLSIACSQSGGDMHLAPRYADILVVGLGLGFAALIKFKELFWPIWIRPAQVGILLSWTFAVGHGLWVRWADAQLNLELLPAVNEVRVQHVRAFVSEERKDFSGLEPGTEIPYRERQRLTELLSTPEIRNILPPSVRRPLPIMPSQESAGFHLVNGRFPSFKSHEARYWQSQGRASMNAEARLTSAPVPPPSLPLLRFRLAGESRPPAGELFIQVSGEPSNQLGGSGNTALISAPNSPFQVFARSAPGHWLGFSEPIEISYGSWIAPRIARTGSMLVAIGISAIGIACLIVFLRRLRAGTPLNLLPPS